MPFPESVPILTDGVVTLRAHTPDDVTPIVEQCVGPDSVRWTTVPRPYTEADASAFLDLVASAWESERGHRSWAIEWTDEDGRPRFGGTLDLRPTGAGVAVIGFGLHPAARGRGLMTRAVRLLCRWWWEQDGVRVYWFANAGNLASWRVAWACGFTRHETLPQRLDDRGLAADAWCASLGREDDLTRPAAPWLDPPSLKGDGVRLRAWRDDDRAVAEPHNHPPHHVPGHAIPTAETFDKWLLTRRDAMARGARLNWCIADAATDDPLGEVLVFVHSGALTDGDTAELGYFLRPSARGRGVAEPAARLAVGHALRSVGEGGLGLRRLTAVTAVDNVASNVVLQRCGFTRWGHEAAATAPDGSVGPTDHWERLA